MGRFTLKQNRETDWENEIFPGQLEAGWCLVHGAGECNCGKRRQAAANLRREFFGDPHLGDVTELEWLEYLNAMTAQQNGCES